MLVGIVHFLLNVKEGVETQHVSMGLVIATTAITRIIIKLVLKQVSSPMSSAQNSTAKLQPCDSKTVGGY